jgi:hypothetical protein
MVRTTANQRDPAVTLTPQQTLDSLMQLGIDGPLGMNIMAIARTFNCTKAHALTKGIVEVTPAGANYTLKVSRRA